MSQEENYKEEYVPTQEEWDKGLGMMSKKERKATKKREEEVDHDGKPKKFDVGDYFSKGGFEDGDNDALAVKAEKVRPLFIKILNEEFEQRGYPYKAIELNYSSTHNSVRACVQWEEGGKEYEWEFSYWGMPQSEPYNGDLVESTLIENYHPDDKQYYKYSTPKGLLECLDVAEKKLREQVGADLDKWPPQQF